MCSICLHLNKGTGEIEPDTNKEHRSKDQVLYPARYGLYSIGGCWEVLHHLFEAMIYSTAPTAKPKQMETGHNIGHIYKMENGNYNTELLGWSLPKTFIPITTSKLKVNWQHSLWHCPFHSSSCDALTQHLWAFMNMFIIPICKLTNIFSPTCAQTQGFTPFSFSWDNNGQPLWLQKGQ